MTLKVIGAGFGRTGTDSMRHALNKLGFGLCHHMHEVSPYPERRQQWRDLMAGAKPDWPALFDGFQSCVDWPSAFFWRELIDAYPDAKVLLTTRTVESWHKSIDKTIFDVARNTDDKDSLVETMIRVGTFDGRIDDAEHVMDVFRRHEEEVKAGVAPDRLLVYPVGSGWEPLCTFLDVPVPDEPFPRTNNTAEFQSSVKSSDRGAP